MRRCVRAWGACASGGPSPTPPEKRRPRPGDEWHPDEVVVRIRGKVHHLWRAVDRHGTALDVLVRSRRDAEAARRFFEKLPKGSRYVPRAIVTDKLESYGAAERELLPGAEHRRSRYSNDRAEVSHQPTRRRERRMRRFRSARHGRRFLSSHGRIRDLFQLRHHLPTAVEHRAARDRAFQTWRDVAGVAPTA